MPLGFDNVTQSITYEHLENLTNVSSYPELMINVNMDIYSGYLFLILLFTLWIILFISANKRSDSEDILVNLMTAGAIVSVLSFILRIIYVVKDGLVRGLLTDSQMWIFPILTLILAAIVWATKER